MDSRVKWVCDERQPKIPLLRTRVGKGFGYSGVSGWRAIFEFASGYCQGIGSQPRRDYRMLACLEERGYVLKEPNTRELSLKSAFISIGSPAEFDDVAQACGHVASGCVGRRNGSVLPFKRSTRRWTGRLMERATATRVLGGGRGHRACR